MNRRFRHLGEVLVRLAQLVAASARLGKRLAPEISLADEALPYLAEALGMAAPPCNAAGSTA